MFSHENCKILQVIDHLGASFVFLLILIMLFLNFNSVKIYLINMPRGDPFKNVNEITPRVLQQIATQNLRSDPG